MVDPVATPENVETAAPIPGAYLTKEAIEDLGKRTLESEQRMLISPRPKEAEWTNWGCHLSLGASYTVGKKHSDARKEIITIEPGEFALLLTHERVYIPLTHVAFISMRLRYALKGLVNVSGFHVDPGYHGKLLFSVYNASPRPVTLRHRDAMFMLVFARLSSRATERNKPPIDRIEPEHIDSVQGPSISLVSLGERLHKLEDRATLLLGLLVAVIVGFVVTIIRSLILG